MCHAFAFLSFGSSGEEGDRFDCFSQLVAIGGSPIDLEMTNTLGSPEKTVFEACFYDRNGLIYEVISEVIHLLLEFVECPRIPGFDGI